MPLEIRCLGHFLTKFSLLVWPLMSHAKKKKKIKKQRCQLKGLGKKKLGDGKGNQHHLVARILFGDLSPQSLLEKERGTVSYKTASVERGQYRK